MKNDYHFAKQPFCHESEECGDTGVIIEYDEHLFLALVDALGHGTIAANIAQKALTYLEQSYRERPAVVLENLHEHLKGTRGSVAAVCSLNCITGSLSYSGIGNISIKRFGSNAESFVTRDGILGYMIPSPVEKTIKLYAGDILVMHSDGIKDHIDPTSFPNLLMGNAKNICSNVMTLLKKENDDASCIILRYDI